MKKLFTYFLLLGAISACDISDPEPEDPRRIFLGNYQVEQESFRNNVIYNYSIRVLASENDPEVIYIENFYNSGSLVFAEISGNIARIPKQVSGFNMYEGRITYSDGFLDIDFIVYDAEDEVLWDECLALCTKI